MATETYAGASRRPRPWLLVLLGVVVAAFLLSRMFSGRTVTPGVTSTGSRPPANAKMERIDPSELDVKIEALKQAPAAPGEGDRNPFRFQPKPPPAPPPLPPGQRTPPVPVQPPESIGPPPPTPIGNLIKFIGIVDTGKGKIGAFSDCRYTFSGREGEVIEGRFRVVRIGVESAIVEYADGRGRTTLPLNGQGCVGK
jgi:hypothetical protein